MKKIILARIAGRKRYQRFFQRLYYFSLKGMNYGGGAFIEESGELNVLKYLQERFKNEDQVIAFDAGANQGQYTTTLIKHFTKITIHAFEPSAKTFEILKKNIGNNKNIIINNFGLSDKENTKMLYYNEVGSGMASVYHRDNLKWNIKLDIEEEIKVSTIENYCKTNNISKIHFLKIDTEGHDLFVLKGAQDLINNKRIDAIQFEFGGCNIDSRTYFRDFYMLLSKNYKIYRILKDGLFEMITYNSLDEIFTTVNFLAIRK